MNKQKLLDRVQAAKDHLDEAVYEEKYEIGNILNAVAQLADVLEKIIEPQPGHKTVGDVINELATRPDIDIYILERALAKRCYPDRDEYICVQVDHRFASDSPGRAEEKRRVAELLANVDETLRRTAGDDPDCVEREAPPTPF